MDSQCPIQARTVSFTDISNACANKKKGNGLPSPAGCDVFLPLNEVDSLIQPERVRLTLTELRRVAESKMSDGEMSDLVEYIMNHAKKIFLILVITRTIHNIMDVKKRNFEDQHLPVYITGQQTDNQAIHLTDIQGPINSQGTGHSQGSNMLLEDFTWSDAEKDSFYEKQWVFLAPNFSEANFAYTFENYRPLPFLPAATPGGGAGHFGTVQRLKLHFAHYGNIPSLQEAINGSSDKGVDIAVKRLTQIGNETDVAKFYDKENSTLEVMRSLKKDHLIRAIATYKKGNDRYFLFPWAKGGNLQDMLEKDERKLDKDLINWIVCQIVGLSEGIAALHANNIRHGDIKPSNILCDGPDLGASNKSILLIADVGLAKKHEEYTRYRPKITTTRHGSITYEPPEVSPKKELGRLSRKYDVWSLGCVFLELIIWAVYGTNGIKTFHKELNKNATPQFWKDRKVHSGEKVHSIVKKRFKDLKKDLKNLPALAHLVEFIEEKLLKVSVDERPYSTAVYDKLKTIKQDIDNIPEDRFNAELTKLVPKRETPAPAESTNAGTNLATQYVRSPRSWCSWLLKTRPAHK